MTVADPHQASRAITEAALRRPLNIPQDAAVLYSGVVQHLRTNNNRQAGPAGVHELNCRARCGVGSLPPISRFASLSCSYI